MRSMTGFGRSVVTQTLGTLTTELKSVNHRYCQVSTRLPSEFSEFEPRLVSLIKEWASRGQISLNVEFLPDSSLAAAAVRLDFALAKAYASEIIMLQSLLSIEQPLTLTNILTLPGVLRTEKRESSEEERWNLLESGLKSAWENLLKMREAEGDALNREMSQRLNHIRDLRSRILADIPDLISYYQERLAKRIADLTRSGYEVDQARIVMEAGILADRADATEELTRLGSHCDQFEAFLKSAEPVGRQMDFLLQELNREANTIASKAAQGEVVALCVALKTEIERLREQAQNVE